MLRFSFKQIKRIAEKKVFSSNASNTPNDKGAGKGGSRLALAVAALGGVAAVAFAYQKLLPPPITEEEWKNFLKEHRVMYSSYDLRHYINSFINVGYNPLFLEARF